MHSKFSNLKAIDPLSCYSNKMMTCNRIIANIFRKHLKEFEITDSQLSILFFVSKSKNVNQKRIADFLVSEKSTINRNINRLIAKNYLSQNNHLLKTTENGYQLLEKLIPSWEKAMKEVSEKIGQNGEDALNLIHSNLIKSQC